jgi:hypothetical protein
MLSKLSLIPLSLPANLPQDYECKMCGEKFGESFGDMQRHILTEHMQKEDLPFLKTK